MPFKHFGIKIADISKISKFNVRRGICRESICSDFEVSFNFHL